ncbi:MAG: preprotein translocase subunit SecA, partial [Parcubacteria group bacterium CG11_big_fil_rev_8_21_14_0_20_41_14]
MRSKLIDYLAQHAKDIYAKMSETLGDEDQIKDLERAVLLNSIDTLWMDHLEALDNLRTAVGLRGYGQRDPLVEYKRDAYGLFKQLQGAIQNQVVYSVFKILSARSMQMQGAGNILQALGGGLSALQGMRFSAPAKEG